MQTLCQKWCASPCRDHEWQSWLSMVDWHICRTSDNSAQIVYIFSQFICHLDLSFNQAIQPHTQASCDALIRYSFSLSNSWLVQLFGRSPCFRHCPFRICVPILFKKMRQGSSLLSKAAESVFRISLHAAPFHRDTILDSWLCEQDSQSQFPISLYLSAWICLSQRKNSACLKRAKLLSSD
jgi:hypothetical protein